MANEGYKPPASAKGTGIAAAAALAIAAPAIMIFEGHSNTPHYDSIAKVWDVCYGDRTAEKRTYTDAECASLLVARAGRDYAEPIAVCVPQFTQPQHKQQFAASIVLSYNIGVANFCRSSAARLFNAGHWRDGCDAFRLWNTVHHKYVRGLARRREAERAICRKGLT